VCSFATRYMSTLSSRMYTDRMFKTIPIEHKVWSSKWTEWNLNVGAFRNHMSKDHTFHICGSLGFCYFCILFYCIFVSGWVSCCCKLYCLILLLLLLLTEVEQLSLLFKLWYRQLRAWSCRIAFTSCCSHLLPVNQSEAPVHQTACWTTLRWVLPAPCTL